MGNESVRTFVRGVGNTTEERCEILADYIIKTECTVRAAAGYFGVSKSTVHKDITKRLRDVNFAKFTSVSAVISRNKSERHIRGGLATKMKYKEMKNADGNK